MARTKGKRLVAADRVPHQKRRHLDERLEQAGSRSVDETAAGPSSSSSTDAGRDADGALLSGVCARPGSGDGVADIQRESRDELLVVVEQLGAISHPVGLEYALRVGAVVIRHLYGGDTLAWRARGETPAFKRLAEHPALPLSAGALARSVALYELCDRLQARTRWVSLGASHLRLVLGMPSAIQEKLLATANAKRWSTSALQQEVELEKARRLARASKKEPIARSLLSVQKRVEVSRDVIYRAHPTIEEAELGIQLIEETKSHLDDLTQSLRAAIESANENSAEPPRHDDAGAQAPGSRTRD